MLMLWFPVALLYYLWSFLFLGTLTPCRIIYTPRVFIAAVPRTNQGRVLHGVAVEPTIHLWMHVDRMTSDRVRKCPPPLPSPPSLHPPLPHFINKHTGHSGGDAVRLNRVSERPAIGGTETLAKQILLPHFCTVGKYLTDCRLCVCVFALLVFWSVCSLWRGEGGSLGIFSAILMFLIFAHLCPLETKIWKTPRVGQFAASLVSTFWWSFLRRCIQKFPDQLVSENI